MPTVGEILKQTREKQKLTISQLADSTKIRGDHIRALEEGDFNVFSAPVYIRGFIRTLAATLKLDVQEMMQMLDAELCQTDRYREPPKLTGEARGVLDFIMLQLSKVNWKIALPILAGFGLLSLALISYRAWRLEQNRDPLRNLGPGLYKPAQPPGGDILPLSTNVPRR